MCLFPALKAVAVVSSTLIAYKHVTLVQIAKIEPYINHKNIELI